MTNVTKMFHQIKINWLNVDNFFVYLSWDKFFIVQFSHSAVMYSGFFFDISFHFNPIKNNDTYPFPEGRYMASR